MCENSGGTMRALDCPCGLTLTAEDDEALYVAGRRELSARHCITTHIVRATIVPRRPHDRDRHVRRRGPRSFVLPRRSRRRSRARRRSAPYSRSARRRSSRTRARDRVDRRHTLARRLRLGQPRARRARRTSSSRRRARTSRSRTEPSRPATRSNCVPVWCCARSRHRATPPTISRISSARTIVRRRCSVAVR